MIYLTPKYSVNYRGVWHNAGEKPKTTTNTRKKK